MYPYRTSYSEDERRREYEVFSYLHMPRCPLPRFLPMSLRTVSSIPGISNAAFSIHYVTNDEVLRRTGVLSAPSIVRKRRLGLFGHVARLASRRWCSGKPDPPDLLQSSRRCLAITQLEACSRSTSHHMDPSDLLAHGNTGDWCSRACREQIVLATNRNGWSLCAMMMMMMMMTA